MNDIGFGLFCFGEDYYFNGSVSKINQILNNNYHCYVLTDNIDFFKKKYTNTFVHVIEYNRNIKSYHDKLILPKIILKEHNLAILIDSDLHVTDFTFLKYLKNYNFKDGISYIDTLLNHKSKKEYNSDLIDFNNKEWKEYCNYLTTKSIDYLEKETIWEYFLIFNKIGFNVDQFYLIYEKLQIIKEYCGIQVKKDILGAGEGISMRISANMSDTKIERDYELYKILKDKMVSVSKKYTPPELWPDWMK